MARTYSNTPVLSKIKIGDKYYWLKDADARAILDSINDDVYAKLILTTGLGDVSSNKAGLVDAQNVKTYVDDQVKNVPKFHAVAYDKLEDRPAASADTLYILALVKNEQSAAGEYIEYITVDKGESADPRYVWEQIGTTKIDLDGYVTDVTYTAETHKLQIARGTVTADVHTFGAMADASSATGSVTTVDSAKFTVTPAGTIAVNSGSQTKSVTVELAKDSYTPAGTITGSAISGGTISVTLKDSDAISAALTTASYVPTGTVSKPGVDVTATTTTVVGSVTGGSAAQWAGATYTAPSLAAASTATFAQAGIVATVGTDADAECLIFTSAATATAVVSQGEFKAGSVDFGTFTPNVLPTFATTTVVTGATAALNAAPVFTASNTATVITDVKYVKPVIDADKTTFNPTAATLGFSGTAATVVTGVTSATVSVNEVTGATFYGTEIKDQTVDLTSTAKTVTVTPKTE